MFDLQTSSIQKLPKIGVLVTFFVLTSACAHQTVAPANNDAAAAAEVNDVTPPPTNIPQPVSAEKPMPRKTAKAKHKARSRHLIARGSVKHKPTTMTPPTATPLTPAPQAPAPEITASHSAGMGSVRGEESQPAAETSWERAQDYLVYFLMAAGAVGIVLIASRLERKRVKGRRKIVFN